MFNGLFIKCGDLDFIMDGKTRRGSALNIVTLVT